MVFRVATSTPGRWAALCCICPNVRWPHSYSGREPKNKPSGALLFCHNLTVANTITAQKQTGGPPNTNLNNQWDTQQNQWDRNQVEFSIFIVEFENFRWFLIVVNQTFHGTGEGNYQHRFLVHFTTTSQLLSLEHSLLQRIRPARRASGWTIARKRETVRILHHTALLKMPQTTAPL